MNHIDWYETLSQHHKNPIFTKEDFENCKKEALNDLRHYEKYLPKGSKILDVGCGLGSKSVPLSSLGYKVVGIDNDKRVVEAAKQNAKNFGGDIEITQSDIFGLDKIFNKDSFDACISAGILEHFKGEDARKLIDLQLRLAPLVIASIPVKTERSMRDGFTESSASNGTDDDGIHRNFLSEDEWVNTVLKGYNIVEHFVEQRCPAERNLYLAYLFVKRK
jgi:SAM-dependent methyltransferase